ncbi:acyl carrier protein [Pullulanibacillus camelliae]|uniref:Acyl carrier protein n=1 Tax=Pullulanibacillus camelliae TaxID=1707096 RepID=A0A8J2VXI3_9BACL|nr:acyl carrier protein [Pullulanibacillus camelliae]GGE40061.1 acyl carrier protein [Pullulanibacillus camelliae]
MANTLSKQEIEEKVREVIVNQLDVQEADVKPESLIVDDLGADSLDLTELAVGFEDAFDLEIPDSDFGHLSTVDGVVQYISQRLQ